MRLKEVSEGCEDPTFDFEEVPVDGLLIFYLKKGLYFHRFVENKQMPRKNLYQKTHQEKKNLKRVKKPKKKGFT